MIFTKPNLLRRTIATIIDYGLTFCFLWIYIINFGQFNVNTNSYEVNGFMTLPILLFWALNHVVTEYYFGNTFGHAIVKLKVVSASGEQPDLFQILKRHLADPVDIMFYGIPAFISIRKTDKNQRLGDLWGETIVVEHNFKDIRNFYLRSTDNQANLMQMFNCDNCKSRSTRVSDICEYKQNGDLLISSNCDSCGRNLIIKLE